MTELTESSRGAAVRADKLRAIAAVFGEAVAARIGATVATAPAETADPDRLAWQTNRLIRHLRDRALEPTVKATGPGPAPAPRTAADRRAGPTGIATLAAGEDLAGEHPAVIAHILRGETQATRILILRALPGHVSRAVIQRLRRTDRGTVG